MSTSVYVSFDGNEVFVDFGNGEYTKLRRDGDPTTVFQLPSNVTELVDAEGYDSEAWSEGYDEGYAEGSSEGYGEDELEAEFDRGYEEGLAEGNSTGYAEGYEDGRNAAAEEKDADE